MIDRAWARLEDPTVRMRLLRVLWLVSTAFTALGFAAIIYLLWFQ